MSSQSVIRQQLPIFYRLCLHWHIARTKYEPTVTQLETVIIVFSLKSQFNYVELHNSHFRKSLKTVLDSNVFVWVATDPALSLTSRLHSGIRGEIFCAPLLPLRMTDVISHVPCTRHYITAKYFIFSRCYPTFCSCLIYVSLVSLETPICAWAYLYTEWERRGVAECLCMWDLISKTRC